MKETLYTTYSGLLLYIPALGIWSFFALGILVGINVHVPLGRLALLSVPAYPLFVFISAVVHFIALRKARYDITRMMLLINAAAIVAYVIFAFIALNKALYR